MAKTRPYIVEFQGERHLVEEAISQEQAVSKVVAPHVGGVKVATAREVLDFMKERASRKEEWPITAPLPDMVSRATHEAMIEAQDADGAEKLVRDAESAYLGERGA